MHSLSELRDFFKKNNLEIKEFNGLQIKIGKDVWTMASGVYFLNGEPKNWKQKDFINDYINKKVKHVKRKSNQTRKWRRVSCRGRVRD